MYFHLIFLFIKYIKPRSKNGINLNKTAFNRCKKWHLDYLICGRGQINGNYLTHLAAFYDKRVKIDLIDYPPAKDKNKDKE